MKQVKYLIIGGGIAGTNAADVTRQKDPTGSILLVTEEKNRLYSRVLLPILLEEGSPLEYAYLKKEDFYPQNKVEFWTEKKVIKIDFSSKIALLEDNTQIGYEKLLLATGGEPNHLNVAGENLEGVFTFKTIEEAQIISKQLEKARSGVVIGGRFIAFDFINIFAKQKLKTTVLIREESFFQPFIDLEGGQLLTEILQKNGVETKFNQQTKAFFGNGKVEKVVTESGLEIPADIVGVGIGVTPNLKYLGDSDLIANNHIETNEYLETKVAGVWAAGDVTRFRDLNSGRYHTLGNWANAADQGLVAALNMTGTKTAFLATSSYSIKFFNSSLTILGDPNKNYATEVIKRGSITKEAYGNFFVNGDLIMGATLIGLPQERGTVGNLIKNKVKVAKNKLVDLNFDLKEFLRL